MHLNRAPLPDPKDDIDKIATNGIDFISIILKDFRNLDKLKNPYN